MKISQYLVHGKHHLYSVLVFPRKPWFWAFYNESDERCEIDGDPAAYQQVKYALAALIANSGKIAYFPIRGECFGEFYTQNYDAVLTCPKLQLRRSEWGHLRKQLDRAHKIKNFELYYEPQKLYDHYEKLSKSEGKMWEVWDREDTRLACLENETAFFTLGRDVCYGYHHDIICAEREVQAGNCVFDSAYRICELGYLITPGCKRFMRRSNEWDAKKKAEG